MLQIEERISSLLCTSSYSHIKAEEWKKNILFRIPTDNGKPKTKPEDEFSPTQSEQM